MINVVIYDDYREFRDEFDFPDDWNVIYCKNTREFMEFMDTGEQIHIIALDHDLGGYDTTREGVNRLVEECVLDGREWPHLVFVVTANPAGERWLMASFNRSPHRPISDWGGMRLGLNP